MTTTDSASERTMTSLVIGFGNGTPGARSFAAATGRPLVCAETPEAVLDHLRRCRGGVTISAGSTLDGRQLHQITRAAVESAVPVGFIAGWGGASDAERHAEKLATYSWSQEDTVLLWSDTAVPELRSGRFAGTRFTARKDDGLLDELRAPHRVTALITHGNGIDAYLGRSYLCSAVGAAGPRNGPFFPCGYPDGPCIRSERAGGRLLAPPRLHPREIAADVVIWSTCYGVLAAGAPYDPAWALAAEFARSSYTGALLTTYKDTAEDLWPVLLSLGLLAEGSTLGDICVELNRRTLDMGDGDPPWLLLGDPDVAFPATRPAGQATLDHDGIVRLIPGVNHLELPSRQPHVITVEPAGGERRRAGAVTLCQVPDSSSIMAVHHGGAAGEFRLRAEPAHRDERFKALESIRSTLAPLVFSRSVVDRAVRDPRAKELAATTLRDALSARLDRHVEYAKTSTPFQLAGRLSGSSGEASQHDREIATWVGLNGALVHFLASYSLVAVAINTLDSTRGKPLPPGPACPYCGMPVSRREAADPLSGTRRRIWWCTGCALLSDTSDAVDAVTLAGPARIRPGMTYEYVLDFSDAISTRWRVLHACLRPQRTPWGMEWSGPTAVAVVQPGQPFPTMELKLTLNGSVPVGVYYLRAAIAAHADLWTCRRPVVVEPGPDGPVWSRGGVSELMVRSTTSALPGTHW